MENNSQESDFPELPAELVCPASWPYDNDWEKGIPDLLGWREVEDACKANGSGMQIRDYLTYGGQKAFAKVVIQNQIIRKIKSGRVNVCDIDQSNVDWQSGNTWEKHLDSTDLIFEAYSAAKSPPAALEAINFTKSFIERGWQHSQSIIKYVEKSKAILEKSREEELEKQQMERNRASNLWSKIDVDHSKAKEGFVYALKNELMPGMYKVGFTASNPDKRAKEISETYGLPMPFVVSEYWRTKDPYIVEQRIHNDLGKFRKGGEFFQVDIDEIRKIVLLHLQALS